MNARSGFTIVCLSATTFFFSAGALLPAQDAVEAAQTTKVSTQSAKPKTPLAHPAAPVPVEVPVTPPVPVTTQDTSNDLSVAVGKSVVLDMARPVVRIVVGLGGYAEAAAISPTQVLVNGAKAGETTLILWDMGGGRQFFNVTVRPSTYEITDHLEAVRRELRIALPGQDVMVNEEGGTIFLRGTVNDLVSSNRAVTIASTAGKVVNLMDVKVPKAEPQILLKVRFVSVDRNKGKQMGVNLFSTGLGNTIGSTSTGEYSQPSLTTTGTGGAAATIAGDLNLFAYYPGINLGATIQALETTGMVQVLAEPNVLTENGKEASFLAGGQFPYPVIQSAGTGGAVPITIQFREYGVRLSFLPTITPRGTIRLQVAPEVSSLDYANAVTVAGYVEPALTVRSVKTEVELQDGQSFAIGGLLDNRDTETMDKIPFIGDIPFIGKFFQSRNDTKSNTELIVIVTPEIVSPVVAGQTIPSPKFPSTFLPPNSNTPMHTPDSKTPANTLPPPPKTIPIEQLLESMKPEQQLSAPSSSGTSGGSSMGASGSSSQ
ncbi:MAG TPA: pilus assembly protein N-terminal domain-containing protein [Terracidiphilus sp.]|nr:pilus assembly protein N-terminal domain-containing protein [Terracidiphilus sp.]